MDAMVLVVVADRANNYKQKLLLRLHMIDIAKRRVHFVVLDFVMMDTMNEMDIVHLDTVIATMMHMLGLSMDLVSDSCRMEMQKLLVVAVHNMVVDMKVV